MAGAAWISVRSGVQALEAQFQEALRLLASGRAAPAEAILRRLFQRLPADPIVQSQLARALARLGRREEAAYFARRAGESGDAEAAEEAAYALGELDDAPGAITLLRRAVELNPAQARAWCSLAFWLQSVRRVDEARDAMERAHAAAPEDPGIAANLALIYADTWSLEEGRDMLARLAEKHPQAPALRYALAFLSNYSDRVTPAQAFAEHRAYAAVLARRTVAHPGPPPSSGDASRTLRVGLLSPDLRETSVARFLEPIIREHDPAAVRYTLFPLTREQDETTRRFREWCEGWNETAMQPDDAAAAAIRAEGIDILIDLCGLMRGMRAGVLTARAARTQITYLGYPNTTGLANVDVRIVDSITDPPGAEALATERLVRLDPCFVCFAPPRGAERAPPRGPAGGDPVTFGSFNNLTKVTPATLDLWAKVLSRVPGSRLLVKAAALASSGVRARLLAALGERGVEAARVEIAPYAATPEEHLRRYHRVDVALDTYPYHGATTTCEALYMGVPVVTLEGDRHASRVGASLLTNAGTPELIARTGEEYIANAAELAGSPSRRSGYHADLRSRLMSSPLGDAPGFARRFEEMLRGLWSCGA